jgi:Zn-dependent protease with chaperone function
MYEADFIHGCMSILGSLATIAVILTALGTILGLVKPADALKYCGVIVGLTIVIVLIVSVLVGLWSSMSVWQRVILAVIGLSVWRLRQKRREPQKRKEGE